MIDPPRLDPETRDRIHTITRVSRETEERLRLLIAMLCRWQSRINLIGASTLSSLWTRHVVDSIQIWPHIPDDAQTVTDFGSGGGFPGLVLAVLSAQSHGPVVHLIESDTRKAAFLATAAQATGARALIHAKRIEEVTPWPSRIITARACASLTTLLEWAEPFVMNDTECVFLKGRSALDELTAAQEYWTFRAQSHASLTEPSSHLLVLSKIHRAGA